MLILVQNGITKFFENKSYSTPHWLIGDPLVVFNHTLL